MAIRAGDITFTKFFDPTETKIYKIPIYQREYSWKQEHCESLLNDIQENDSNYFIGSIIWVENTNEVIDGQQRLTSINLLLVAIYNRMCAHDFGTDEDINFKKSSLKRMIVSDKKTRLVLQKQGKNKEDFEYLLNSEIIKVPTAKPNNYGNRRISKNYNWFKEYVKSLDVNETKQLFDKICKLTFISASVDNVQIAYILFETMNNRGMALSAIDLIKNSYLCKTDDENSISNWESLIEILGSESNQEQFLRNNYNAFRSEYNNLPLPFPANPKYELANKATRSNVIKIYASLVGRKDFMEFLTLNAKYNSLLTGEEKIDTPEEFKTIFKNFRNANATSAFMLLLYLLRNQIVFGFNDSQMLDLFELTLKFFIRRNLTNNPSTGALPQILMIIIERINQLDKKDFVAVRKILLDEYQNKTSSNDAVKGILYGDIYDTNRDMARYLLCSLCKFENNNEKKFIDLWEKKDDKYIWTIEHILPEGNKDATNTPNEWVEMIKQGDVKYKDYSNEQVYELVKANRHKIGNLTMTGYNSSLGNKKFSDKKDRYDSNKEKIGYNNGIGLNDYVYKQSVWYISSIVERTKDLAEEIMTNLEIK